jgi:hypothetical protein
MRATQHTIDATIRHNGHTIPTRIAYQYEADDVGLAHLTLVDAGILVDDHDVPAKVNNWAQDWLDCEGYDGARQHAEGERAS